MDYSKTMTEILLKLTPICADVISMIAEYCLPVKGEFICEKCTIVKLDTDKQDCTEINNFRIQKRYSCCDTNICSPCTTHQELTDKQKLKTIKLAFKMYTDCGNRPRDIIYKAGMDSRTSLLEYLYLVASEMYGEDKGMLDFVCNRPDECHYKAWNLLKNKGGHFMEFQRFCNVHWFDNPNKFCPNCVKTIEETYIL